MKYDQQEKNITIKNIDHVFFNSYIIIILF